MVKIICIKTTLLIGLLIFNLSLLAQEDEFYSAHEVNFPNQPDARVSVKMAYRKYSWGMGQQFYKITISNLTGSNLDIKLKYFANLTCGNQSSETVDITLKPYATLNGGNVSFLADNTGLVTSADQEECPGNKIQVGTHTYTSRIKNVGFQLLQIIDTDAIKKKEEEKERLQQQKDELAQKQRAVKEQQQTYETQQKQQISQQQQINQQKQADQQQQYNQIMDNYKQQQQNIQSTSQVLTDGINEIANFYKAKQERQEQEDAIRRAEDAENARIERERRLRLAEIEKQKELERIQKQKEIEYQKQLAEIAKKQKEIELQENIINWKSKTESILINNQYVNNLKKTTEIYSSTISSVYYIIWCLTSQNEFIIYKPYEIKKSPDGDWMTLSDLTKKLSLETKIPLSSTPDGNPTKFNELNYLLGYIDSAKEAITVYSQLINNATNNGYKVIQKGDTGMDKQPVKENNTSTKKSFWDE